jgi:hypothetical protein
VLALLAALPILLVLVLMLGLGWPASRAGIAGAALALVVAILGFGFGTDVLPEVGLAGGLAGVAAEAGFTSLTILWIIFPALAIYHLQVATGGTDVLRVALGRLSGDPRILALLIAWFFTLFMEGGAGFGSPVALAAPFLVGVGYKPLVAVVIAMIGNGVGVSFGAIGTPIVPMVAATDFEALELSAASAVYHLAFGLVPLIVMMFIASRGTGTRMTRRHLGLDGVRRSGLPGPDVGDRHLRRSRAAHARRAPWSAWRRSSACSSWSGDLLTMRRVHRRQRSRPRGGRPTRRRPRAPERPWRFPGQSPRSWPAWTPGWRRCCAPGLPT